VEDIRLFGPSRVSHFDILLGTSSRTTYLLIPFSIERELALREEKSPGIRMLGSGGRVHKGFGSPQVDFSLRFMSTTVPIMSRKLPVSKNEDLVWDALERMVYDNSLVGRNSVGCPMLVIFIYFTFYSLTNIRIRLWINLSLELLFYE
jgi:hypothetical protein